MSALTADQQQALDHVEALLLAYYRKNNPSRLTNAGKEQA